MWFSMARYTEKSHGILAHNVLDAFKDLSIYDLFISFVASF